MASTFSASEVDCPVSLSTWSVFRPGRVDRGADPRPVLKLLREGSRQVCTGLFNQGVELVGDANRFGHGWQFMSQIATSQRGVG
jgi:hypothetical protein